MIAVSDRESVNINTGERFQISGHTKVSFSVDAAMKELVNRPFAHFEAVDLNDDTDAKEFEEIDDEMNSSAADDNDDDEKTEVEDETNEEDTSQTEENTEIQTPLSVSIVPTQDEEPTEAFSERENAEIDEEKQILETDTAPLESQEEQEEDVATDASQPSQVTETANHQLHSSTTDNATQGYVYSKVPMPRKRNWWKIVAVTLSVIAIMALSYFVGYYRMLCPDCGEISLLGLNEHPAEQPKITKQKADTVQQTIVPKALQSTKDSVAEKAVNTQHDGEKVESKEEQSNAPAIPAFHVVSVGDNVYRISRKYYGTDDYADKIIKENNLSDANMIVVGMKLKLPRP